MDQFMLIGVFLFVLFLLLGTGVWVGLALMGVAFIGMEMFTTRPAGDAMITVIWKSSSSWTLTALPLFIWMGEILYRTRLSQDMFRGLAPWMARLPGGLLHTNIVGCTIFAAVSGSSAATLTTVGKMSVPELRSRGYPEFMTIGTLAGAATLGLMIPPSLTLIVYGVTINESITQLFMAGVLPGLTLAGLFMAYVVAWHFLFPSQRPEEARHAGGLRLLWAVGVIGGLLAGAAFAGLGLLEAVALFALAALVRAMAAREIGLSAFMRPGFMWAIAAGLAVGLTIAVISVVNAPSDLFALNIWAAPGVILIIAAVLGARAADPDFADKLWRSRFLIPVLLLVLLVIGSMYGGWATATEAAAFGVIGALVLATFQGSLTLSSFTESLMGAARTSAMIALILMGASFLSLSMGFTGLPRALAEWIAEQQFSPYQLIIALTIFYIIIGCFLDGISSVVLTMAVVEPMVRTAAFAEMGFDMIWFGIFIVVVVEMAQITPPIGFNLFVMQGMTGHEIGYVARTAAPMFLIMCLMVALLVFAPELATWLPRAL